MKASILLVAGLAAGLAAALATPAMAADTGHWKSNRSERQACLQIGRIENWRAPNDRTLIVDSDTHKKYRVDLLGHCPGLNFAQTIGFRSMGGMRLSCITPGDVVFFHSPGMEMRCAIRKVSPYRPPMKKKNRD